MRSLLARSGLHSRALVMMLVCLGSTSTARGSAGEPRSPGIVPIRSNPLGKSYAEWALEWLRWHLRIPAQLNPALDASELTGERCSIGQTEAVWFLAGAFQGGKAVRRCTVPAGMMVFFPVFTSFWLETEMDAERENTVEEMREHVRARADSARLSAEIDGRPVTDLRSYREQSAYGPATLPEGNLFADLGVRAGIVSTVLDDGFYLMLEPLARGEHTIHFRAVLPFESVELDVTYFITVADPPWPRPSRCPMGATICPRM